jgi:hypothetical protein
MPNLATVHKNNNRARTKLFLISGLILGAIFLIFFSTNLDSLRKPIINELSRITELSIEIESLRFSLSNGLSLRGNGLKVSSKDNLKKIFSAQDIFLSIKLKPILKGQFKIKKIILVKPTMDISLGSNLNFISLQKTSKNSETIDQSIRIKSNVESNEPIKTSTNVTTLKKSLRNLFQNKNFSLRAIELKDALLTFNKSNLDLLSLKNTSISLSARLNIYNTNRDKFDIDGDLLNIEVNGLSFKGTLKAKNLLGGKTPIDIDLVSSSITAKKANAIVKSLSTPGSIPVEFISGQIEKIFINLKGAIDSNENPFNEIIVKSGFQVENLEMLTPNIKKFGITPLHKIYGNGLWENGTLSYEINGIVWDGTIQSNITINLPNLLEGSLTGKYNSTTKFNDLDLSSVRFNRLNKWIPATGAVNGYIKIKSSFNNDMRISGKLDINNLSLENKIPYTAKQVSFNFSQKSRRHTLAEIRVIGLQLNNILINTASSKIKFSPEIFSFNNGRIIPSNGIVLFSGHYRPKSNSYMISINGNKIFISDFLEQQINGSGNFNGMFQGNLDTAKLIKQKGEVVSFSHFADGLSGKFSFIFRDGDLNPPLWTIKKLIPTLSPPAVVISKKIKFRYKNLIGDFVVWKGKVTTKKFELKGPKIDLTAVATANLVNGKIDGGIKITPVQLLDNITEASLLLGNIFKKDLKKTIVRNHFNLEGTLEKPKLIQNQENLFTPMP